MAGTANSWITPQTPKQFTASINAGDAQNWKFLRDAAGNAGAGANLGSVISSITATQTDVANNISLATVRAYSCTWTSAAPGVCTISTGHNISNGDQCILGGTTVPTGFTAGTTYYAVVVGAGLTPTTLELSATFGGTGVTTSSTGTAVIIYIVRVLTTVPIVANAGTNGTAAAANFFNPALWPGFAIDVDGNPYMLQEVGDFLAVSAVATVGAGKIINVAASAAGNF
jgi:hypothetical protein